MARPRFSWSNLDQDLLNSLASEQRLKGDAAKALEQKYGIRPKADFIKDAWPTLLERWLSNDAEACISLANSLRAKGLGSVDIETPLAYLRSCRNTINLRETCILLFISRGEKIGFKLDQGFEVRGMVGKQKEPFSSSLNDKISLEAEGYSNEEILILRGREASQEYELIQQESIGSDIGRNFNGLGIENPSSNAIHDKEDETFNDLLSGELDLSDASLNLVIALLPSEIVEGLLKLRYINENKEWIAKERSESAFQRAVEIVRNLDANEFRSELQKARVPNQNNNRKPLEVASSLSVSTHTRSKQDIGITNQPKLSIRWNKHTPAISALAFLLVIAMASGPVGFIMFILIGAPIALFSYLNDYNAQQQAIPSSFRQESGDSGDTITCLTSQNRQNALISSDVKLATFLVAVKRDTALQKNLKAAQDLDGLIGIANNAGFKLVKEEMLNAHETRHNEELSSREARFPNISLQEEITAKEMWSLYEFGNDARYLKEQEFGFDHFAYLYCCNAAGSLTQMLEALGFKWDDATEARFWSQMEQ